MTIRTTAHLNFRGDTRAALEFYQKVFGGEITLVTYQDAHSVQDPLEAEQIMWGQVQSGNGFQVMGYDVPQQLTYDQGVNSSFMSVRGTDADELTMYWQALSDGATIRQELGPGGWSSLYGRTDSAWSGSLTLSRNIRAAEISQTRRSPGSAPNIAESCTVEICMLMICPLAAWTR